MKYYLPILDNGGGNVRSEYVVSFIASFTARQGRELNLARSSDSHPGRGRNRVAASFLESSCTHLLFIDGDIVFRAEHIDKLEEFPDVPILCGMYFLKVPDEAKPCLQTLPDFERTPTGGLISVARAGTGFMRISREVFEAMKPHVPSYWNHGRQEWDFFQSGVVPGADGRGEWLSEDWYFCDVARKAGFEINMHTGIQLGHIGTICYPLQDKAPHLDLIPPYFSGFINEIWEGEYRIDGIAPTTVLDIGANIGGFSVWAREQWPTASILAYEPHPDNAALWRINTRGMNNVHLIEAAVTERDGPVKLVTGQNCGEHSIHLKGAGFAVPAVKPQVLPSCDFLKIDTEGCEVEILRGADLSQTKAIALEYHSVSDRDEIAQFLAPNFEIVGHKHHAPGRGVLKFKRRNPDAIAA